MAVAAGVRLGPYEILAPLGAGGMGEVYAARDTRLAREVAVKVLPASFAHDADRLRRFEQEARATSALNHPNILTVHDIGTASPELGGAPYIVAELLEGEELRAALKRGAIELPRALDYAQQIASGLAAAHAKNIVHRDLKPENLFVTTDGFVKILDFGLAKLRPPEVVPDSEAPTQRKVTDPGTVMGTANYMSPEQARGQEVDARSDIFSLGVVLHEMIAGCATFTGVNALDVIGAILNQEPAPLRQHSPDTPAELQRIVSKSLRKDREQRYQHVKDLLIDLKDLKQELEFEAKLKGAQAFGVPPSGGILRASTQPPEGGTTNAQPAEAATNEVAAAARTTSSAEIILGEIKRHKRGAAIALAVLVLAITGLAFGLYKLLSTDSGKKATSFQAMKLTRLTAHGQAVAAAVSPDGKYVVYAKQESAGQSLWLRQVAVNNSDVQIAPTKETEYNSFTYSPDGNFIYYVEGRSGVNSATLYRMSALGRNPTKLFTDRGSLRIAISPDGQRLAFTRTHPSRANELIVTNLEGKDERVLAVGDVKRDLFNPIAWSPDGKSIAVGLAVREGPRYETVIAVNVESGKQQPMTTERWASIGQIHWLHDGSGLVILASEPNITSESTLTSFRQLWHLSLPDGSARRLTNDLNSYDSLSLTADASNLVMLQKEDSLSLWVAPNGDASRAKQLPRTAKDDGERGLAWTPDGKIVYASTVSGSNVLWLTDANGGGHKQLNPGNGWQPALSADGAHVAFISTRSGHNDIWLMEVSGGGLKQFTADTNTSNPSFTSDGKWLVFAYRLANKISIWKKPLDGGEPVQLTDQYSHYPNLSPDGKLIAYIAPPELMRGNLAVMPIEGGTTLKSFELPPTIYLLAGLRWSPDGRAITYVCISGGVSNIWGQPLAGGAPKQLTDFKTEQIRAFAWSRDGQLAVSRGVVNSDVVLITDFKQQ